MSDQSSGAPKTPFSAFALPSVALLIVTTIGYIVAQPPLKSSRPTDVPASDLPPPPSSNQYPVGAVYARMWEDPLGASYRDALQRKIKLLHNDGAYDKIVKDQATDNSGDKRLLVMPVLLPGSPSAEDLETRKRIRYAVLAGLANAGYELRLNDRMSYVRIPVHREFKTLDSSDDSSDHKNPPPFLVPTKLYRLAKPNEGKYRAVLICWINQSQLGDRPLNAISQIYKRMFSCNVRNKIQIAILGPRGSDALRTMLEEQPISTTQESCEHCGNSTAQSHSSYFPKGTYIYSPSATASLEAPRPGKNNGSIICRDEIELVRSIGTDRELVDSLVAELRLRGIHAKNPKHGLVLITERDTVYGRSIKDLFVKKGFVPEEYTFLRGVDGRPTNIGFGSDDEERTPKEEARAGREVPCGPSQLDYLRRLASQLGDDNEERRREGRGEIRAIGVVGTDFYDKLLILRALRKRFPRAWFFTTDLDAGFLHPDELGHTQNLLVASHFGLTLHRNFQGSVPPFRDSYQTSTFFATLLALEQVKGRQNDDDDNGDNLEVNNPLRCCGPIDPRKKFTRSAEPIEPLVFEIGRNRAYQLTKPRNHSVFGAIHPASPRESSEGFWTRSWTRFWWVWVVISFCLCLANFNKHTRSVIHFLFIRPITFLAAYSPTEASWQRFFDPLQKELGVFYTEPYGRRKCILSAVVLFVLVFLVVLIWCDTVRTNGEPFSLTDGISTWPTNIVRLVVVFLGIVAFVQLEKRFEKAKKEIDDDRSARDQPAGDVKPGWTWKMLFLWKFLDNEADSDEKDRSVEEIIDEFDQFGCFRARMVRAVILSSLFFLGVWVYFSTFGDAPNRPTRGNLNDVMTIGAAVLCGFVITTLFMLLLDGAQMVRALTRSLGRIVPEHSGSYWGTVPIESFAIKIIGEHSKVIGDAMWWPAVLILVVVFSRSPWFDGWHIPLELVLLVLIMLGAIVLSGFLVRLAAHRTRTRIIKDLRKTLKQDFYPTRRKRTEQLIAEIEEADEGAYRPLSQDPFLWALTVPFGGAGGLLLLERMLNV